MAEECTATSAIMASNSPTVPHSHGWWDMFQTASSWHHHHHHHQNPNVSNSSNNNNTCEQDDVLSISTSLTNASNHSVLTVDHESSAGGGGRQLVDQPPPVAPPSSATHLIADQHASDTHLWTQVLSSVGSNGEIGDNLFEAISSKATSPGIFEPACSDYLKKIDTNNWEFPNPSSSPSSVFNNFVKNLNGYAATDHDHHDHDHHHSNQSSIESERLSKLSNLVSNWSIAPPDPELNHLHSFPNHHHHIPLTNASSMENYSHPTLIKNPVFLSSSYHHHHHHDHNVKMEAESGTLDHMDAAAAAPTSYNFRRAFKGSSNNNNINNFINNNNPLSMETAANNLYGSSSSSSMSSCTSATTSTAAYNSRLSKPLVDIHASNKPCFRPLLVNNLSDIHCKKQGLQPPSSTPLQQQKQMQTTRSSNGRTAGGIANEGKKKRSGEETSSDTLHKKPKQETSTASSSVKMHAPKVKLGDRITAFQQIVSPFGKTDTASVLLEAIGYINFLQEQVQLLSNPYMKPNCHKDPWGSLDRKDEKGGEMKVDLRSRGLCLVPISCAPQVYHETTGSDYWTPTHRGCLYR